MEILVILFSHVNIILRQSIRASDFLGIIGLFVETKVDNVEVFYWISGNLFGDSEGSITSLPIDALSPSFGLFMHQRICHL